MSGMILTDRGREILLEAIAGENLHFIRGAVGDGAEPQDPESLTALVNERLSLGIRQIRTRDNGTCEAILEIDNTTLQSGIWLREFGLFVTDPETLTETLYAYCNKGNYAGYLEGYDGHNPIIFTLKIITVIDNAQNITVDIDSTDLDRLTDRVSVLEQAFQGITPALVKDKLAELTTMITWDSDDYYPDYSDITPSGVANLLRHIDELLSWDEAS